jgi:pectin methylesterase-like acyl-CoA thioesterase
MAQRTVSNGAVRSVLPWLAQVAVLAGLSLVIPAAAAQSPIILPNTISTVAGGAAANPANGAACAVGSPYTATDAFGDGCPATLVTLGSSLYGEGTDPYGNIFFLDTTNEVFHRVDARSGILSRVAGGATTVGCTGQADKFGDNCLAATQTGAFNNPRGMSVDPYGNVIIADYGDNLIHIVCNTVSPLCTSGQIGYMRILAGYAASSSSSGTATAGLTAGSGGDGTAAVGVSTTGVDNPRGTAADVFGNVYIADTANIRFRVVVGPASYNGVTNPLAAAIALDSTYSSVTGATAAGKIYPILGGFTAVTAGNFCNGSSGAKSLDAFGDGCPFYNTAVNSSNSSIYGVVIDSAGDAVMSDAGNKVIRVLYMGGTQMGALITLENPGVTPVVGSVYALAGGGTHGISTTPLLATSLILNTATRVTMDSAGNIYLGETTPDVAFIDANTGFGRVLFASGTACAAKTDTVGDGCPAAQSSFGVNSLTLSISVDNLGNLIMADSLDSRIRKISASSLMPMVVGTSATQNIVVHEPAGTTGASAALTTASPDISLGAVSCAAANSDGTLDCTIPVTLDATAAGFRTEALAVAPTGSSTTVSVFPLVGLATGSALVADGVTSSSSGSVQPTATLGSQTPLAVAVDGANNVYSVKSGTSQFAVYVAGGSTTATLTPTAPTGVSQIAVDSQGNLYAVGSGSASITKLTATAAQSSASGPPSYSAGIVSYTPVTTPAKPQGVAVDGNGNLYVSDGANGAVYKISQSSSLVPLVTVASGFTNPTLLALDNANSLYVYDKGATTIYKITYAGVQSTFLAGVTATGLATDAALNVYVQTASGVTEYPASGPATVTVYSGGTTPNGIAVDGNGNLYVSDAGKTGILEVLRTAVSYSFGTGSSSSPTLTGTLTNVGNQAVTGSNTVTNTTNFAVVAGASNGCSFSSSILGAQTIGNACTFSATFVGNGSGAVSDVLSYLPASTSGSLSMSGTLSGVAISTTTTISGQTPANPSYSPSGTEVTFTVTVTPASGTSAPAGTIAVTVDSTTTHPSLTTSGTNGVATVTVSGLTAGAHTISAIYSTNGSFTGSNSGAPTGFSVAQDTPVPAWTPGATSLQYSAPVGTSILNATATFNSAAVPGTFVYTANGAEINPSSYLAIGSYTLNATFYPVDTVDYATATIGGGTLTVGKASTTAAVGATQMLVASDSTGNFASVQAAINTLGANGGSVYIKPGTYTGSLTVVQPNVALRGLGGDPTKVILTHSGGAFNNGQTQNQYAGEFNSSQNNGFQLPSGSSLFTGDQGSGTLVVARGVNTAFSSATFTPNNFYAENLSLLNSYNTDTTTTTTTYELTSQGACTASAGPAQTYSALFNAGIECASQALAIWITGDTAVLNNVYTASLQDTIYAGSISSSGANAARQYWFRGKVTGNVDFIFGDAAAVFDHTSIYTAWHGTTATGTETIEAQNQADQTGATTTYLSGYIMNSDVFTSQSTGMTNLYLGRPYGTYSTWVMLNSYIDQVNATGYTTGLGPTLLDATYGEYNNQPYTDPTPGSADLNGVIYPATASGGNTGSGVTSTRESISTNPGTLQTASGGFQTNYPAVANTTLSPAEAQQYYPLTFLSATVPTSSFNTVTNWNPLAAMAANVNAFVPSGASASVTVGSSVTILMRPQTPGLGAVTNGTYTIPTGSYTLTDTVSGSPVVVASGTLDASGEAYFTSSALSIGTHNLTWTYSGDSNFSGSTTASAYVLTVTPVGTTTTLGAAVNPIIYGQSATITATVTPAPGSTTPTGTVTLTIDGGATQNASLSGGVATFTVNGLTGGAHSFSASYAGGGNFAASSTSSNLSLTVNKAGLTVTAACSNRIFGQVNVCNAVVTGGYQYSDTVATVFTAIPTGTTAATRSSPAGGYSATPVDTLSTFGGANYTVTPVNGSFTVSGGAVQSIVFPPLPNFVHGASYQLTARTTSGLPVTYTVTAGSATVSGSTLTVTGTGLVTVQASQSTDPTGDYAAATSVSRSFTAQ